MQYWRLITNVFREARGDFKVVGTIPRHLTWSIQPVIIHRHGHQHYHGRESGSQAS